MDWLIFALIAPLIWAIVNLIDDKLLHSVYRSATFGAVISGFFGFLPGLYFFITNENAIAQPVFIGTAVAAGFLTVVFYYFYFKTLGAEDPSVAMTFFNMAPAMVPFLAYVFLDELLHTTQYLGLAIIIAAGFFLSVIDIKKLRFSPSILTAIAGSLAFAGVSILSKYAYEGGSFREVYAWISLGFAVGACFFLSFSRNKKEFKQVVRNSGPKILLVLVIAEIINIAAELTQGYAINGGPVSIVRGLEGIQPLYVLLIGITLSPIFPKHFRETKDRRLPKKLLAMIATLVGLFLIQSQI